MERLGFSCLNSGNCYAQKWKLTSAVNNLDLTITTLYPEAEMSLPFDFYEGTTTITGTVNGQAITGKGFAELLQTYENPSINISYPNGNGFNTANAITWELANPNEGNPITYELQYSTDNKNTYTTIANGLTVTAYNWNNPPVNNGENIWFKIIGSSVDGTLTGEVETGSGEAVTLSIAEIFSDDNLKVYPNPAGDFITVEFNNSASAYRYTIYNQLGQILSKKNVGSNKIFEVPIDNYSPGLYFLKLRTNSAYKSIKIMKK